MTTIQPLRKNWAICEDKGYVPDQIKERVNSESNYEWCKRKDFNRSEYMINQGREYLKGKSNNI